MCCSPWGRKELDMTKRLNNQTQTHIYFIPPPPQLVLTSSSLLLGVCKEVHTDVSLEDSYFLLMYLEFILAYINFSPSGKNCHDFFIRICF